MSAQRMAAGVMEQFRNIGVIGREGNGVAETLRRLLDFLQQRGLSAVLDEQIAGLMDSHALRVCSRRMIGEICDLIIVCLLYTSPSPRDATLSRMPSSA